MVFDGAQARVLASDCHTRNLDERVVCATFHCLQCGLVGDCAAGRWLLAEASEIAWQPPRRKVAIWIAIAWIASMAAFIVVHRAIGVEFTGPVEFGLSLHRGGNYFVHLAASLVDRQLWYIFVWLLPTAIPNLRRIPRAWLAATGAACLVAFALDGFYGGAPGTIGRALFTVAGPMLSLSSAMLLVQIL